MDSDLIEELRIETHTHFYSVSAPSFSVADFNLFKIYWLDH